MNQKLKNVLKFMLFLGIGIFFIWIFLRNLSTDQKHEIVRSMGEANYFWIILAIPLGVLAHYTRALRWKMLLEPLGHKPGNLNMFFAVFVGYLANLALPRLGEIARCSILTKYEKLPFNKGFGTVITERVIDMVIFVLLFFLNLALQANRLYGYIDEKIYRPLEAKFNLTFSLSGTLTILVLAFAAVAAAIYLIFRKRILGSSIYQKLKTMVMGFVEGMKSVLKVRNLWLFIFYSLAIWALYLLMAYIVFFGMQATSQLGIEAGLAVLVFGSIGIMIVQGGIGIYPAIVAETLVLYGVSSTQGYALGWLIWSSQTLTIIIFGVLSLILLPVVNNRRHAETGKHP